MIPASSENSPDFAAGAERLADGTFSDGTLASQAHEKSIGSSHG